MTAHDVCFSVRGVKDLFPDLLLERGQEKKFPGFFKKRQKYETFSTGILSSSHCWWGQGSKLVHLDTLGHNVGT